MVTVFSCPVMDLNCNRHLFCTEDPDTFGYNLLTNHYTKFTQQRDSIKEQCGAVGIFCYGWDAAKSWRRNIEEEIN